MRTLLLCLALAGCTDAHDAPVDTDDVDTETPDDTDAVETDAVHDSGPPDSDADTDTPPTGTCGRGAPVSVVVSNDRLWYVSDATVRWFTADGREGDCARVPDEWDRWTCDAPLDGDLLIAVTHPLHTGFADVIPAGLDGCRAGGEVIDANGTLSARGLHFAEDRLYFWQRFEDPEECASSWALHGIGCYQTATFCADGYSAVFVTDIPNFGTYELVGGTIENHVIGVADIPVFSVWQTVDDHTLIGLQGQTFELDTEGRFEIIDCGDTGL